jgi:hypothetical protein
MTSSTPTRRRTPSRRCFGSALAATAVLLPALLAGCSTTDAPGSTSSPSVADAASASSQLGECLRDAGYNVPDPDLSKGVVVAPPEGADPDRYAEDFDACRSKLPESQGGGSQEPSDAEVAEWQKTQLKVAECVREKGFEDFPDPVDGNFPGVQLSTSGASPEQEAFFACSNEFGPNATGSGE